MSMNLRMKHTNLKQLLVAEAVWLAGAISSLCLQPFLTDIYSGSGYMTYAVSTSWLTIPWVGTAGATLFCGWRWCRSASSSGVKDRIAYYCVVLLGIAYLAFSFLPLCVTIAGKDGV